MSASQSLCGWKPPWPVYTLMAASPRAKESSSACSGLGVRLTATLQGQDEVEVGRSRVAVGVEVRSGLGSGSGSGFGGAVLALCESCLTSYSSRSPLTQLGLILQLTL